MVNRRRMPPQHLEQNISNRYLAERINGLYDQLSGISDEKLQSVLDEIDRKLDRLEQLSGEIDGLDVSRLSAEIKSVKEDVEYLKAHTGTGSDEERLAAVEQAVEEIKTAFEDPSGRLSRAEASAADAKQIGEAAAEDISETREELKTLQDTVTQFTTKYQTTGCIFEQIN